MWHTNLFVDIRRLEPREFSKYGKSLEFPRCRMPLSPHKNAAPTIFAPKRKARRGG